MLNNRKIVFPFNFLQKTKKTNNNHVLFRSCNVLLHFSIEKLKEKKMYPINYKTPTTYSIVRVLHTFHINTMLLVYWREGEKEE